MKYTLDRLRRNRYSTEAIVNELHRVAAHFRIPGMPGTGYRIEVAGGRTCEVAAAMPGERIAGSASGRRASFRPPPPCFTTPTAAELSGRHGAARPLGH